MSVRGDVRRLRRGLAALRPHARGEGGALALGFTCGALAVVFHLLRPWPLKWILDAAAGAPGASGLVAWTRDAGTLGMLAMATAFVALTAAFAAATYWQVMLLNGVGNRVLFRFRAALFAHVLKQPLAFHERHDVGELLTRVVYDSQRFRRGVNGIIVSMAQTLLLFAGTLAVLLWLSLPLGAVLGVGAVAAFVTMYRRGRRVASAARKQRKKEGSVAALVEDELHGVREIHALGPSRTPAHDRFVERNQKSLVGEQKVRRLAAGMSLRVEILFAVTIALTVLVATRGAGVGAGVGVFGAGDLVLFLTYALALRGPFDEFARQTARLGRTAASASRLVRLIQREPALADAPGATPAPPLRGDVRFEGATLRAPRRVRTARKWTLDDVWLAVPPCTRVAVMGGNGAGKSSLLRLALRLADPDAGRVLIDGRDAREYALASLRAQYSVVFQDSVLFGLSVRDNIRLGTPAASDADVALAAERAAAAELIDGLPEKYDTLVRRRGGLFSPGERQRLAIARAMLRDGRVWLLDEPTAGLDHATARQLTDALLVSTSGRTTLWVTHDPTLVPRLDLVAVLGAGRVAFTGTPADYAQWRGRRATEAI